MGFFRQEYCNSLHTFSSSRGSFLCKDWTHISGVSCISGGFFTCWAISSAQFSFSVLSDSVTPWTAARQASLSVTNSQSYLKLMSIESMMPSSHLILSPLLLQPSIFPSIRVFSNKSVLYTRWPRYCLREALEFCSSPQLYVRGFIYCLPFLLSGASLVAQKVKNLPEILETLVRSLGHEDPLEKGVATPLVFLSGEFHGQGAWQSPVDWQTVETGWTSRVSKSTMRQETEKQDPRIQWKALIGGPTPLQSEGVDTESRPALL